MFIQAIRFLFVVFCFLAPRKKKSTNYTSTSCFFPHGENKYSLFLTSAPWGFLLAAVTIYATLYFEVRGHDPRLGYTFPLAHCFQDRKDSKVIRQHSTKQGNAVKKHSEIKQRGQGVLVSLDSSTHWRRHEPCGWT